CGRASAPPVELLVGVRRVEPPATHRGRRQRNAGRVLGAEHALERGREADPALDPWRTSGLGGRDRRDADHQEGRESGAAEQGGPFHDGAPGRGFGEKGGRDVTGYARLDPPQRVSQPLRPGPGPDVAIHEVRKLGAATWVATSR